MNTQGHRVSHEDESVQAREQQARAASRQVTREERDAMWEEALASDDWEEEIDDLLNEVHEH